MQRPHDLGQVQVDEIRVKQQGQIVWLAMALQVATRLWLGAVVSTNRDQALLTALLHKVRRGARCRPLLVCGWLAGFPVHQSVPGLIRNTLTQEQAAAQHAKYKGRKDSILDIMFY